MKTEHTLIPWTTEKGYGEECTKCGFRFTKKMEGETIIITPAFYGTEEYKKCPVHYPTHEEIKAAIEVIKESDRKYRLKELKNNK